MSGTGFGTEGNLDYFTRQQCSVQWRAFLRALSSELGSQIPESELRILMARLGKSMAQSIPAPTGNTLEELKKSINSIWFDMNWGWVNLIERDNGLFIEHHVAPLLDAFGEEAMVWSPAILEGIYAHWFAVISSNPALQLTQIEPMKPGKALLRFRFGRPD